MTRLLLIAAGVGCGLALSGDLTRGYLATAVIAGVWIAAALGASALVLEGGYRLVRTLRGQR